MVEFASINWFPVEKISKVVSRYFCADIIKHLVVWAISMFSFAPCWMVTQVYWILTGITRYVPPKRCTLAFTGHYVSGWHVHCTHWFIRTVLCDDWKNDWQIKATPSSCLTVLYIKISIILKQPQRQWSVKEKNNDCPQHTITVTPLARPLIKT